VATCRDIVKLAMKLTKILPAGGDPDADEAADGLLCFQSLLGGWVTGGMFGRLQDEYLESSAEAEEGVRYRLGPGASVTAPALVDDEMNGGKRAPFDLSVYETVADNGDRAVKLYDRTGWVDVLGLALGDDAPLASRGEAGLAAALATSGAFAAMFNDADVSPRVERLAAQFVGSLSYKAGTTQPKQAAEYF